MDKNLTMTQTVEMARESLESGKALECFRKFVSINS